MKFLALSRMQHNTTDRSCLDSFPCMCKSQLNLEIEFSYWDEPTVDILATFLSVCNTNHKYILLQIMDACLYLDHSKVV